MCFAGSKGRSAISSYVLVEGPSIRFLDADRRVLPGEMKVRAAAVRCKDLSMASPIQHTVGARLLEDGCSALARADWWLTQASRCRRYHGAQDVTLLHEAGPRSPEGVQVSSVHAQRVNDLDYRRRASFVNLMSVSRCQ